jgi:hypothetical protein
MMKKLTLSVDPAIIEHAKRLAKQNNTSVSTMFERMIRLMSNRPAGRAALGPITRKVSGVISLPRGKSSRQMLEEALVRKHATR